MIVKNESEVIRRCLDSVKPHIDYWVIVDTGSTDGTQEIIKEHMKDIPGELYERPWRNFGENRSEAYKLAKGKGEYILFMDADDVLEFKDGATFPLLTKDMYMMWRGTKEFSYIKPQLAKASLPWKWIGVTHEYLDCGFPYSRDTLENVRYISVSDGASSHDPEKFQKNVKLLLQGLKDEPHNTRYAFYLAESYYDAGEKGKALEAYQKRIEMGGWPEEVFWSKLRIAHLLRAIGLNSDIVSASYLDAHKYRPHRAESLYYLSEYYIEKKEYQKAYDCIKTQLAIAKPVNKDYLFNEDWIEDSGLLFQLSICSYYTGHYQESLDACDALLAKDSLPDSWHDLVETNRYYPISKMESENATKAKQENELTSTEL